MVLVKECFKSQVLSFSLLSKSIYLILALDNDDVGRQGEASIRKKLEERNVQVFDLELKAPDIKDLGDLLEFYRFKNPRFNDIINSYKYNIVLHGGKLC